MSEFMPAGVPQFEDKIFTYVLVEDVVYFFPRELGWGYRAILRNPSEVIRNNFVKLQKK